MFKFKDVPKGKRFKYFIDYYGGVTVVAIICLLMIISIVKVVFFRENEDLNILISAASTDLKVEHTDIIKNAIIDNYDIDFDGNGKEALVISEAIMSAAGMDDYKSAEQDLAAAMKLTSVIETSLCTIQLLDENMYNYLLEEQMIETYENLEKYGFKGEGYIKIPLSETKLDPKNKDPLYLTIRPENSSRIAPEAYRAHIELVKQIIN